MKTGRVAKGGRAAKKEVKKKEKKVRGLFVSVVVVVVVVVYFSSLQTTSKGNDRLVPRPEVAVPAKHPLFFTNKEYVSAKVLHRSVVALSKLRAGNTFIVWFG